MHGNYAMHKDGLVAGRDERRDGGPGHPGRVERPELLGAARSIEGRGLRRSVRVFHAQPHCGGGDGGRRGISACVVQRNRVVRGADRHL